MTNSPSGWLVLKWPRLAGYEVATDKLELLAREPFSESDLEETGPSGRKYAIRVRERIILTYWVDHAVKEVRVIRVEIC